VNGDGYILVVFQSSNGENDDVKAQLLDVNGNKIGALLVVDDRSGDQDRPAVDALESGDFVVSYNDNGGVAGVLISAQGQLLKTFRVNTVTAGFQGNSVVQGLSDGNFVIAFHSEIEGYGTDIVAQQFDAQTNKVGNEFIVNSNRDGYQLAPAASRLGSGFVLGWEGNQNGNFEIYMQRFDSNGIRVGNETLVNTLVTGDQDDCDISETDEGFVFVWETDPSETGETHLQRFNATGERVGTEIQLCGLVDFPCRNVKVSSLTNGNIVAVFEENPDDPDIVATLLSVEKDTIPTDDELENNGNQTALIVGLSGASVASLLIIGLLYKRNSSRHSNDGSVIEIQDSDIVIRKVTDSYASSSAKPYEGYTPENPRPAFFSVRRLSSMNQWFSKRYSESDGSFDRPSFARPSFLRKLSFDRPSLGKPPKRSLKDNRTEVSV